LRVAGRFFWLPGCWLVSSRNMMNVAAVRQCVVTLMLLSITKKSGANELPTEKHLHRQYDDGDEPFSPASKQVVRARRASDHHHHELQKQQQERSLAALPPCDSIITEDADYHDIYATNLNRVLSDGQLLVVNGNFVPDCIDTIRVTLGTTTTALSIQWYVDNSAVSHIVAVADDEFADPLAVGSCGLGGPSFCTTTASGLTGGTSYIVRMASESSDRYQLRLCGGTTCNWPDPPNFGNLNQCDSSGGGGGDTGGGIVGKFKIQPPSFTAAAGSGMTVIITGTYPVSLPFSEANGAAKVVYVYRQSVHTLVNGSNGNQCSDSVYNGSVQQPLTGSANIVQAAFSLNAATLPASIFNPSTGVLRLCHRMQLRKSAGITTILMNQVDTVVSVQIRLSATFGTANAVQIVTQPNAMLSASAGTLSTGGSVQATLWNPQTGAALTTPLRAGQALLVRVADTGLALTQLLMVTLTTSAGKTMVIVQDGVPVTSSPVQVGPIDCASASLNGACEFALSLPFVDFFDQSYVVQLSGTALLGVVRRDLRSRREEEVASSSPLSWGNATTSAGAFLASFETVPEEDVVAVGGSSSATPPKFSRGGFDWSSLMTTTIAAGFVARQVLS
jgi:hypothetical protein